MMEFRTLFIGALAAVTLVGCGNSSTEGGSGAGTSTASGGDMKGSIDVDGSSTVFPIANAMGEDFTKSNPGVSVTVNKSGTGSGFQKFERGEIAVCTASRPIKADEDSALKAKGIEYVEVPIAYDGVSVVVNPENTWAMDMSVDDLKKAYTENSSVKNWRDINPAFPASPIKFYGPSDNHGTYEYFQEAVLGKKVNFRKDYQANQEYNAIIQSVAADKNSIAYVGYNYFAENKDKVKAVKIAGVEPSDATVADGSYKPLSRPLFLYIAKKAMDKPEVKAFIEFALTEGGAAAVTEAKYVVLPQDAIDAVKARVAAGTTGSAFMNAEPGMGVAQVLAGKK